MIDEDDERQIRAMKALAEMAAAAFPEDVDITLSIDGRHTGSIVVSPYTLMRVLEAASK